MRTEYVPHGVSPNVSDQAQALRRHVLERLTIFLAEARRNKSDWTVEGLNKEGTFVVQEVRDLKARYTYVGGGKNVQHHEVCDSASVSGNADSSRHCMRPRTSFGTRRLSN